MRRFFATVDGKTAVFDDAEVVHISRVNRLKKGDEVIAQTEQGQYECRLTDVSKQHAEGEILKEIPCQSNPRARITLYMAYAKSEKLEFIAEKGTELGLTALVPFFSSRCVKTPDAQGALKHKQRMQRISREALKQCGRVKPLEIGDVLSFEEMIRAINDHDLTLFAYEKSDVDLKNILESAENIAIIIGPEGGFALDEADKITDAGAKSVSLGKRILRAETAAIALLSVVGYETGC